MKNIKTTQIIILTLLILSSVIMLTGCANHITQESNITNTNPIIKGKANIYLFWQEGCPHCRVEKPFLKKLSEEYPVNVYLFEISNKKNMELWMKFCNLYNEKPLGVPMTFIGDKHFVGFDNKNGLLAREIESQGESCINKGCAEKAYALREDIEKSEFDIYSSSLLNISNKTNNNLTGENEPCDDNETICAPSEPSSDNIIQNNSILTEQMISEPIKINKNQTQESLVIPVIGRVNVSKISLPLFTLVIAGLDGFNPCAIWVLSFLLTLLIYSKSRKKMFLIGLTFVITSGVIYFLFMTAWLNFFLLAGYTSIIRLIIGAVAVLMGLINLKDSFWFKKGLSLTISEKAKPKLFKRMRTVVKESQKSDRISISAFIGTIALAITANLIELACTAGFPAVYTRVLTLRKLSFLSYYSYLIFYNSVYIIPLLVIVLIFSLTLGAYKFSERSGRILKFIGGALMLILGIILIYKPELLMFA